MSDQTARERAEDALSTARRKTPAAATLIAGRRIGWALLDVADAIREHTAAQRQPAPPPPRDPGKPST